jgi:hypothetical protein
MHCNGKILLNCPLKRDHLSYQARYPMYCDGKILLNCPLKRDHLSYQARYLMYCDGVFTIAVHQISGLIREVVSLERTI